MCPRVREFGLLPVAHQSAVMPRCSRAPTPHLCIIHSIAGWVHNVMCVCRSTTVFSHAQTVVLCASCNVVLCQPTGGKARLTEGQCAPPASPWCSGAAAGAHTDPTHKAIRGATAGRGVVAPARVGDSLCPSSVVHACARLVDQRRLPPPSPPRLLIPEKDRLRTELCGEPRGYGGG